MPTIISNTCISPFAKRRGGWDAEAPTGLALTIVSDTAITLNWTNVDTTGDGVSIERSTDGVTYAEVDTVALGVATFADTGLTANTLYYYRVRAYKGSSYSEYSSVASATTYTTEALAYKTRVEAAGGSVIDFVELNADVAMLKTVDATLPPIFLTCQGGMKLRTSGSDKFVSNWYSITQNYDFAQTSEDAQPHYNTSTINEIPVITNETSRGMTIDANGKILLKNKIGATIIIIAKPASAFSSVVYLLTIEKNTLGSRLYCELGRTDYKLGGAFRRLDADTAVFVAGANDISTDTKAFTIRVDHSSKKLRLYQDYAVDYSSDNFMTTGNYSDTSSNQISILSSGGTAESFSGDVFAIIVYDKPMTVDNINTIINYFDSKIGNILSTEIISLEEL